jgi:hypothetical protein
MVALLTLGNAGGWPVIDWTISLGNLLQIGAFVVVGIGAFFAVRSDIRVLRHDVQKIDLRQDGLQTTLTNMSTVLTTVAVQDTRLTMAEKTIDELRHGQGFVNPMRS